MALGDDYVTSAQLKDRLGIPVSDTQDDTRIAGAVSTASRDLEEFCGRQFNKADVASSRVYFTRNRTKVLVDDFYTTTDLVIEIVEVGTDGAISTTTALTSSQYVLEPLNGISEGVTGWPWWRILNLSTTAFRPEPSFVRVTARWGWAVVPEAIAEAALIMAEEYFKMKEAPWGVANWGEFGPVRVRQNPIARDLLKRYSRGRIRVR